ncbi:MAG: homoserine kinase [Candidatus Cloacimonadota bacterium]|nr:homoserine kinase [Candidatus Cloacimonadota bacterium]
MKLEKIKIILEDYDIGDVIKYQKMPHGFANRNYKITTSKGNYLFRINVQQDLSSINYEIRVLDELKKNDFPTAYHIIRKDGRFITELNTENVVIYDFIEGDIPRINAKTVEEIASVSARLNSTPNWQNFEKKNPINIDNCFDLIKKFNSAKYKYPKIFEYFIEQTKFLEKYLRSSVPQGLIHADIFPDNTIFNGDKLAAIIDFEDVCTDDLIFEMGMAINGFCFINNELNDRLLKVFISNYSKVRPLSKTELELLPIYIQWTAHGMVSWHLQRLMECKHERQLVRTIELMDRVKRIKKIYKWGLF